MVSGRARELDGGDHDGAPSLTDPIDAADLARWRAGDEAAFRALYRRHAGVVLAVLRRMVDAADAEDALQEAWLRAARGLGRFDGRSALRTWVIGIAINCAREARRRRGEPSRGEDVESVVAAVRPTGDLRLDLERAVAALPEGYRMVLVLHDVWGHTHAEVAAILGVEEATSRSQLTRARRMVRQGLEGQVEHGRRA